MTRIRFIALALAAAFTFAGVASAQAIPTFPPYDAPADPVENPSTPAKIVLGKILFWDEQVSSDNTVACGTCHHPSAGGSDPRAVDPGSDHPGFDGVFGNGDDVIGSRGVRQNLAGGKFVDDGTFFPDVQRTGRKTPPFTDGGHFTDIFWDGRARSEFRNPVNNAVAIAAGGALESQAVGPPVSDVEMGHVGRVFSNVLGKLRTVQRPLALATNVPPDMAAAIAANPTYQDLFNAAFGSTAITGDRFGMAIGAYERSLNSTATPWDDFNDGNMAALTATQQMGLRVFLGLPGVNDGRCHLCHAPPLFSDDDFHNIGFTDPNEDVGRMSVTMNAADLGKMKTPSLRNVGLREAGGLFHNGRNSGDDIDTAIASYVSGIIFPQNIDPLMQPLALTGQERVALADFLRNGLTDPRMTAESFPFDRPTLRAELQATLPPNLQNPSFIGAGHADSAGNFPQFIADQPPNLGNPAFTLGVENSLGGAVGFFLLGFPNLIDPPVLGVAPLYVGFQFVPPPFVLQTILDGTPGAYGEGYSSVTFGIHPNPFLAGMVAATQWFVVDPMASPPVSATEGRLITFIN